MARPSPVPDQNAFWDSWHGRHRVSAGQAQQSHSRLAEEFVARLTGKAGHVADLACGQGADATYFAACGYHVTAVDFSAVALAAAQSQLPPELAARVELVRADLAGPFPFPNSTFVGVYSHLGLHYFDRRGTIDLFAEIWRITEQGGILAFSVKSVKDPYYGRGNQIGEDMFEYKGHVRHFFRRELLADILRRWHVETITEYTGQYQTYQQESSFLSVVATKPVREPVGAAP